MALPNILAPFGTPPFRTIDHSVKPDEVFANVKFTTGSSRARRLFSGSVPRIVTVSWELSQLQMEAVDTWAEDVLKAYTLHFSALVANHQGHGLLWFDANWVEPYTAEPMDGLRWVVTGSLYLTGEGVAELAGPTVTSLAIEFGARLDGQAALTVIKHFSLEITVLLDSTQKLKVEFEAQMLDTANAPRYYPAQARISAQGYVPVWGLNLVGTPRPYIRPLPEMTVSSVHEVLTADPSNDVFNSADSGATFTRILQNGSRMAFFPTETAFRWDVGAGLDTYLSVGLDRSNNIAGQVLGRFNPVANPPIVSVNPSASAHATSGYPRTAGGTVLHVGALFARQVVDPISGLAVSTYYLVGREATQTQTVHKMYLYSAGADAVFTLEGQLFADSGDPNQIADGSFGSFQSDWFTPNFDDTSIYQNRSNLIHLFGQWFLNSNKALYRTTSDPPLGPWTRCDLGFGEASRTSPPVKLIGPVLVTAGTLFIVDGSDTSGGPRISTSTDGGATWVATAPAAFAANDQITLAVQSPSSIIATAFVYFVRSGVQYVAYSVLPYTSWTATPVTGLPPTHLLGDTLFKTLLDAFVGNTDHGAVVYTLDNVAFDTHSLPAAAAYSNRIVAVPKGAIAFAGLAPTRTVSDLNGYSNPGAGAAALAGLVPTVTASTMATAAPGVGAIALTGRAVGVAAGVSIEAAAGAVAATGVAPTFAVSESFAFVPSVGALVLATAAPTLALTDLRTFVPSAGAVLTAGYVPSVQDSSGGVQSAPSAATLTATGATPSLLFGSIDIPGSIGTTISGVAPTVSLSNFVTAVPGAGAITLTGQSGTPLALDSYTSGLWAALSVNQLLTSYTGSLMRVRRSSDNAEQDIGSASGTLDTTALSSFVGSDSAYVVTWYDQSGGGNDFTNATAASQPRIVNAGTYDGKLIFTVAASTFLLSINNGGSSTNAKTVFRKVQDTATPGVYQCTYEYGNGSLIGGGSANGDIQEVIPPSIANYAVYFAQMGGAGFAESEYGNLFDGSVFANVFITGSFTNLTLYKSGTAQTKTGGFDSGTPPSGNFVAHPWRIGKRTDGIPANLSLWNFVIYDSDKTSDVAAISTALA